MLVSATGSGKTVCLSHILREEPGASIAIAHRQELVSQIAIALARNGVRHRLVGAKNSPLVRIISALQIAELGYSYLDPGARTGVAGVDTLIRMSPDPWFRQVRLTVIDEGHHVLKSNKWGRAVGLFPNARGLFPTATPERADGRGLGRHHDGLADALVLAPNMRDLINDGYLTDYRIFAPPSDFRRQNIHTSDTTGEVIHSESVQEVKRSRITGDIVEHYRRFASGKLGVTFAVDVETAVEIAREYNAAGVPAEVITADTDPSLRAAIVQRFRARQVLQLVNVDIFGEGFDLPAIEVVSFGRPTDSFAVYSQQFGRDLRLMIPEHLSEPGVWDAIGREARLASIASSVKPHGIIIDHVGNVQRHLLPDRIRQWTLDRRERRAKRDPDAIPLKVCIECFQPYESIKKRCPYCDHYMAPASRGGPEYVDGDLTELDPSVLAALRGEISRIDGPFRVPMGMQKHVAIAALHRWSERQDGQQSLRRAIAWWAGVEAHRGYSESESYRRFYFRFGVDVANAQTLGAREAGELASNVCNELREKYGVDGTVSITQ